MGAAGGAGEALDRLPKTGWGVGSGSKAPVPARGDPWGHTALGTLWKRLRAVWPCLCVGVCSAASSDPRADPRADLWPHIPMHLRILWDIRS